MNKILKLRLKYTIFFILIIVVVFLMNITKSRYMSGMVMNSGLDIAKPIIEFSSNSEPNISDILPGESAEYIFNVKNTDGNILNEVNINYYIKLTYNDNNLPIQYEIYDITSGTEVKLETTSNQTQLLTLGHEKVESYDYKLVFTWPADKNDVSYAGKEIAFDLDIYAEQVIN